MNNYNNLEILSLGGSLVCPREIDKNFLKNFKRLISKWIQKGKKFIVIVGGGYLARKYQSEAKELGVSNKKDLDWIGIFATYLNATLVKSIFKNLAYQKIITNPNEKIKTSKKIIFYAGWKSGRSTDFVSVLVATNLKIKRVINLSNIDFVYDKDPKKFNEAKPLEKISYNELLKICGEKWIPGKNIPFDPMAIRLAKSQKIKIIILNGKNFENLNSLFKDQRFKGTIIE